jgi:hypothetical protein
MTYAEFAKGARSIFGPSAQEIGHVLVGWSALHSELLDLLRVLMPRHKRRQPLPGEDEFEEKAYGRFELPFKTWAAVGVEGAQRRLLIAVIEDRLFEKRYATLREAALWAMKKTEHLAQYRNDAAHMPLAVLRGYKGESKPRQTFVVTADSDYAGRPLTRVVHAKSIKRHYRLVAGDLYGLVLFVKMLTLACRDTLADEGSAKGPRKVPRPSMRLASRSRKTPLSRKTKI